MEAEGDAAVAAIKHQFEYQLRGDVAALMSRVWGPAWFDVYSSDRARFFHAVAEAAPRAVVDLLSDHPGGLTPSQITNHPDLTWAVGGNLSRTLNHLVEAGVVVKTPGGRAGRADVKDIYTLPPTQSWALTVTAPMCADRLTGHAAGTPAGPGGILRGIGQPERLEALALISLPRRADSRSPADEGQRRRVRHAIRELRALGVLGSHRRGDRPTAAVRDAVLSARQLAAALTISSPGVDGRTGASGSGAGGRPTMGLGE